MASMKRSPPCGPARSRGASSSSVFLDRLLLDAGFVALLVLRGVVLLRLLRVSYRLAQVTFLCLVPRLPHMVLLDLLVEPLTHPVRGAAHCMLHLFRIARGVRASDKRHSKCGHGDCS